MLGQTASNCPTSAFDKHWLLAKTALRAFGKADEGALGKDFCSSRVSDALVA